MNSFHMRWSDGDHDVANVLCDPASKGDAHLHAAGIMRVAYKDAVQHQNNSARLLRAQQGNPMDYFSFLSRLTLCAAIASSCFGSASAEPVFQGRLADGMASSTCTVSGADKCTMFYNPTLNITILNDWNIGAGTWSPIAAPGSAQALAASAGFAASGLTGWVLPTGDGRLAAGAQNQYLSIRNQAGASADGLLGQFDDVQGSVYWSDTSYAEDPTTAYSFWPNAGVQPRFYKTDRLYAVAVRPGDVATVPEPTTFALVGAAVLGIAASRRRRSAVATA